MKCSIFRTLSMVLVAGGILGITSFAAADMVTLPNSKNWEFKYEGEAPIPDVLGGGRETLPTYHVSPAFGGLANYNLASDGDVDFQDFSMMAFYFTGTLIPGTGGKTHDQGDSDGDGDVDFGDFSVLAANFTGTITASIAQGQTPRIGGADTEPQGGGETSDRNLVTESTVAHGDPRAAFPSDISTTACAWPPIDRQFLGSIICFTDCQHRAYYDWLAADQ